MDLLLLLAACTAGWAAVQSAQPYHRANRLLQQGRVDEALPLLDRAIAEGSHRRVALYRRGNIFLYQREYERARGDFDTLLGLESDASRRAAAYYLRSLAWREMGRHDQALTDLDDALELAPKYLDAYSSRALLRFYMGFSTAAAEDAETCMRLLGWTTTQTLYAAIVGYFAWRQARQEAAAARLLETTLARSQVRSWPWPLFLYLGRRLSRGQLLEAAQDRMQQVHAHTTLGLDEAYGGSREAALTHLRWVRDHGESSPNDHAYDLATEELRRLETP